MRKGNRHSDIMKVTVGNYHSASTEGDRSGSKSVDGDLASRWEFDLNNTDTNYIEVPLNDNERAEKVVVKQMVWGGANRITSIRITAVNAGPDDLFNIRELEIYGTVQTEPEVELSTETLEYVLNLANEASTDGVIPSVMIKIK